MLIKEFLKQAFYLDHRINSKIEQLDALNALAQKANATLSDMPKGHRQRNSRLEEVVVKIVTLQEEINADIDKLVDMKKEIASVINSVEDKEQLVVLEKRYLNFLSFEQIAVDLNYSIQHVFRIHKQALCSTEIILLNHQE